MYPTKKLKKKEEVIFQIDYFEVHKSVIYILYFFLEIFLKFLEIPLFHFLSNLNHLKIRLVPLIYDEFDITV